MTQKTNDTATDQIAASIEGFFWPKFLFDFMTKNLDGFVKPIPYLQIINLFFGIIGIIYEWPLPLVAGTSVQQSIEARLFWLPLASLFAVMLYQATNPALYYLIGTAVYFWAYCEGEVICAVPWTLPRKQAPAKRVAPSTPAPLIVPPTPRAPIPASGPTHGVPF
jgi:hypothetical protein